MDALGGLLDGPRARGAFALRVVMDPPWSVRVEDRAPLSLVAMVQGSAWVWPEGGDPVLIGCGDVVVLRGPDPYTFAGDPGTPLQVVIHPGQHCTTPDGVDLSDAMDLGVRTWGTSLGGSTVMIVGTYQGDGEVGGRLLRALPPMVVVSDGSSPASALLALLGEEIVRDEPGQEAVLDRLLDLLIIAVLRAWFSRPDAGGPAWYRAHADPVVGPALRLLHNQPSRAWTVASLAREVGVSRAAFARRFHDLVGEPPMSFLTGWRLALAADLLLEPDATVGSVAAQVGYSTPFALTTAFKRVRGLSPKQHRARHAPARAGATG